MEQDNQKGRGRSRCRKSWLLLLAGYLMLFSTSAWAQSGATSTSNDDLLDTLHNKQVITDEEYKQLKERQEQSRKTFSESLKKDLIPKALEGLEIGTLSYIDYSDGEQNNGTAYSRFTLTRGYINVKKRLTSWLGFRVTPDVYQDSSGNFNIRMKYLYAEFRPPSLSFLTDMKAEVGMGHIPWLDFEESINPYRCQGTMFIERPGILSSADIGVGMMGYLGGQVDEEFQKGVGKDYAGKYGSWHIGVYNGSGYNANEANTNKVPEVRITFRPLPGLIPGLQASYFGLWGEGNKKQANGSWPNFDVNLAMVSYQDSWVTFTGQYAFTQGNQKGTLVNARGDALRGQGWSLFANARLPVLCRKPALFVRYDNFDPDTTDQVVHGDDHYQLINGGLSYEFYRRCLVLVAYESVMYQTNNGGLGNVPKSGASLDDDHRIQVVCQISF